MYPFGQANVPPGVHVPQVGNPCSIWSFPSCPTTRIYDIRLNGLRGKITQVLTMQAFKRMLALSYYLLVRNTPILVMLHLPHMIFQLRA